MQRVLCLGRIIVLFLVIAAAAHPQSDPVREYKRQVVDDVEAMKKQTQVMNDMVFSFAELGFQEFETSKYLTEILEKEGFALERGIAGIPTAWMATWGSGKPVIALGSDIDCIPKASQKPGVARHEPLVDGAPGHGEGHNSGQPLNIPAAIAVKRLMERCNLPGTIKLWPGVGEELLGTKAYLVRAGCFKDVDIVLFTHVGDNLSVSWGTADATGMVSVEYTFQGEHCVHCMRDPPPVARPKRLGCGGVDEHRLELPARAPAPPAALALCHHRRWRSAERRATSGERLVLLPRAGLSPYQADAGDR